ncbi:unnamed protein product [Moneuplotes crassus]|uniref:NADP-dependent oxidoreductase domain-containing protein n=1 Tax=Euplotes crassus TaxID=5936 RepID=A0AAD1XIT9_EUPCR|nr:unnamed protein product [Moneuplotes crassus]
MESSDKSKMVYRYLGNSGLKVSLLSFGTMLTEHTEETEKAWLECAKLAFDSGINYFDSAEVYGFGKGDELLGRAIKENEWRREDLVIAVKFFIGSGPNRNGLSRKKIIEATRASLKRMDLDYCDIVYAHRDDHETPLEEICRAFNWLIKKGYAFYWGTSAWPADMITEAIKICDQHGWYRPVVDQAEYNCLVRQHLEKSNVRLFENYRYGISAWSPLGGGFLTGKYNDGVIPDDSRYGKNDMFKGFAWDKYIGEHIKEKTLKILKGLKELADELGVTQAQLALAWVLVNQDVSTCIIGASKVSQLKSNLGALDLIAKWDKDLEAKVEAILDNTPQRDFNFKHWGVLPARREKVVKYNTKLGQIEYKDDYDTYFC